VKAWLLMISIVTVSVSCNSQEVDEHIVLINIDTLARNELAKVLIKIDSLNPKVMGLDVQFIHRSEYESDLKLISALYNCDHLVMGRLIKDYSAEDVEYSGYISTAPEFLPENAHVGFINALLEDDKVQTLRRFSVAETVKGRLEYHFSVRVAMTYDSLRTIRFIEQNPKIVDINYKQRKRNFKSFSSSQVFSGNLLKKDVQGKIVLIGFLGPGNEDKFFTPLNSNAYEPDIYGLEYLAYMVAQVLEYDE
jgi:CHASE2 domain-containing sensor protein